MSSKIKNLLNRWKNEKTNIISFTMFDSFAEYGV